ncbi:MAG: ATP-dependent protease subunit HslV [Bacteroidia bacterium]|nr:ATP-dependent protease subunit HslV [Bacteroidia bacterium]MDW8348516.1 ATP-dependent protease subunit HslV [Bacteroidia bacterium]
MESIHSTTVIGIIHNGQVAIGADGQATMGSTIIKGNVKKIRLMAQNSILVGFAGATADAFTLLDHFEDKLSQYKNNMRRAAIELAKDWRTDRYLRRLEAMIVAINPQEGLIISGTGDVLEPEHQICAIGSGAMYAYSAARALKNYAPHLSAEEMVKASLTIAADICIYTNHNIEILTLIK